TAYALSTTAPTNAGTYKASATYAGDANHSASSDEKTYSIGKGSSSTTVTGGSFVYDGKSHAATVSVMGAGGLNLTAVPTYGISCDAAPITVAQGTSCTASYVFPGDANHNGSNGSAPVVITPGSLAITMTGPAPGSVFPIKTAINFTGTFSGAVSGD